MSPKANNQDRRTSVLCSCLSVTPNSIVKVHVYKRKHVHQYQQTEDEFGDAQMDHGPQFHGGSNEQRGKTNLVSPNTNNTCPLQSGWCFQHNCCFPSTCPTSTSIQIFFSQECSILSTRIQEVRGASLYEQRILASSSQPKRTVYVNGAHAHTHRFVYMSNAAWLWARKANIVTISYSNVWSSANLAINHTAGQSNWTVCCVANLRCSYQRSHLS